jgi:hypothetical protein
MKSVFLVVVIIFVAFQTRAQSHWEFLIGGKAKYNFHNQKEVSLTNNDVLNYSKELTPYNILDAIVELGLVYRPKQNYFIEGRASFGSDSYKYLFGLDLSTLGFGGIYNGLPLGLMNIQSNPAIWFKLNSGYSFKLDKFILDLGGGLVWQPALESGGLATTGVSIKPTNQLKLVAFAELYQFQTSHIYQNCFARFLFQNSKHNLFNHLGLELGYTNKLIGRFRKSVMDVTYTDSQDRTFVNKQYDFQRSVSLSILYRF